MSKKTKLVVSMPQHAADKITADPQAFIEHMRKQGINIESVSISPAEAQPDVTIPDETKSK